MDFLSKNKIINGTEIIKSHILEMVCKQDTILISLRLQTQAREILEGLL